MIILSKLRVKGCVSSLRDGGGRGGRAGREWGGGEVKGEKSGENKIRGGSVCACGVKSHGGGGCRENSEVAREDRGCIGFDG